MACRRREGARGSAPLRGAVRHARRAQRELTLTLTLTTLILRKASAPRTNPDPSPNLTQGKCTENFASVQWKHVAAEAERAAPARKSPAAKTKRPQPSPQPSPQRSAGKKGAAAAKKAAAAATAAAEEEEEEDVLEKILGERTCAELPQHCYNPLALLQTASQAPTAPASSTRGGRRGERREYRVRWRDGSESWEEYSSDYLEP